MATDASKAQIAVTGAVSKGLVTATAPTGSTGTLTGFTEFGWISEDGVEVTIPANGDATPIKTWQNGTTIRTVRTPSDDLPSWHFTVLETNLVTVEAYFGVTVTQTATEGSFEYRVQNRGYNSYVIDSVDGADLARYYVPKGTVADIGAHTLQNGDVTGYEITIEGELDPVKNYNFKHWNTRLKT